MMIMEIFRWQNSDPLWGLAVWCLLPLLIVEVVFLILGGVILRASAVKAGKGWILGFVFFLLGIVLECGFTRVLRFIFPYQKGQFGNWLLSIVIALILVGIVSYSMYHLFEWIDCALYDHFKKTEALHRKALGLYQRHQ